MRLVSLIRHTVEVQRNINAIAQIIRLINIQWTKLYPLNGRGEGGRTFQANGANVKYGTGSLYTFARKTSLALLNLLLENIFLSKSS